MKTVEAIVQNRRTWILGDEETEKLRRFFRFRVPHYQHSQAYKMGDWDGYRNFMRRDGSVPTGLYLLKKERIEEKLQLKFLETLEWQRAQLLKPFSPAVNVEQRPYMRDALRAMLEAPPTGGIILQATGSGKTALAAYYLAHLQRSGVFVVDELTLLDQTRNALRSYLGKPIGIVGRSLFEPEQITCATVQTLYLHREKRAFRRWFRGLDVVILDELHLMLNRRTAKFLESIEAKTVFGLTATLQWKKIRVRYSAASICGPVLFKYPLSKGVEEGYLSKGVVVLLRVPFHGIDYSYNYQLAYQTQIVENSSRNGLIVSLVQEGIERGKKIVLIVERIDHIQLLHKALRSVKHRLAYGAISREDRLRARDEMNAGTLPLIICNRVFGKGIDISTVSMIIDACASKSPDSTLQRYGRGTRVGLNKAGLIYVDLQDSGNFAPASSNRASALKASGIQTLSAAANTCAREILSKAEKALLQT